MIQKKRIKICNQIIEEISKYDRKFFLNKAGKGNLSRFFLKEDKLYYEDEWKKQSKEIKKEQSWGKLYTWINHGGTICGMINDFANFIYTGKMIIIHSDYWGYSFDSLKKIHKKAKDLGLCEDCGFRLYDYSISNEIIYKDNEELVA